jgi:hypothetical protein
VTILQKAQPLSSTLDAATMQTAPMPAPLYERTIGAINGNARQPLRIMLLQSPANAASLGSLKPGQTIM